MQQNLTIWEIILNNRAWVCVDLNALSATCKQLSQYVKKAAMSIMIFAHGECFKRYIIQCKKAHVKRIVFSNDLVPPYYHWHLSACRNLLHLEIPEDRHIQDRDIRTLTKLQTLILPKNKQISDTGIILLNNLLHLDLSGNKRISDQALQNKSSLRYLKLVQNQNVTPEVLANLPALKYICIGYNKHFHKKNMSQLQLAKYPC